MSAIWWAPYLAVRNFSRFFSLAGSMLKFTCKQRAGSAPRLVQDTRSHYTVLKSQRTETPGSLAGLGYCERHPVAWLEVRKIGHIVALCMGHGGQIRVGNLV